MKDVYHIHTDGGARGNPGPAAVGVVIHKNGILLHQFGHIIGKTTNNVAEYRGVIEALLYMKKILKESNFELLFILDSMLIVNQLNGIFKIKEPHLRELHLHVKILEQDVGGVIRYTTVPREQNRQADKLVNRALDEA
ncbi:MAG: Ribonuclease H [Microgenomates group bacterium GW2011_GWB1_40_9]|nr:MAG: Ribonuclease H [Microgenomates group bacterium GW2011_GWC1_39_12]KKR79808.1 MAG: Ribonuclease H [Microgenomates group bacterium GW2011_GWB1_40_9]